MLSKGDEGVLDPWVADWIAANGDMMQPPPEYTPEYLAAARPLTCPFPTRPVAKATDHVVGGVPIRTYEHDRQPDGLIVYFHGGGFCTGSIGLMENIATELAHCAHATVVSVEYRLTPEHPYPAGLDDCETVTRWALSNASRLRAPAGRVVVAGESAGGNLAAAVSLRLRGEPPALAGQLLIYPVVASPSMTFVSRTEFGGPMLDRDGIDRVWAMYCGGQDLEHDPFVAPLEENDLSGLPPALVVLGGCDVLRDEGREYARRLQEAGVAAQEASYPGQPHGFINLNFPAAEKAYERIGLWLRGLFGNNGLA
jgi:acetyl esterase